MSTTATYADNENSGFYKVVYLVNKTGEKLTRGFFSPYAAKKFINKLRYSKNCTLISYPNIWGG